MMIKILITAILMVKMLDLSAQTGVADKKNRFEFIQSEYDFGKIPQGKPVTFDFRWVNTGKEPISIRDVQASCGCTTPEWDPQPVKPGDTSVIKIGYNSAAEGSFDKVVTVLFNNEQKIIRIKGMVYPSPATSAPLNASVILLKQNN